MAWIYKWLTAKKLQLPAHFENSNWDAAAETNGLNVSYKTDLYSQTTLFFLFFLLLFMDNYA